jgi:hypothetical protein
MVKLTYNGKLTRHTAALITVLVIAARLATAGGFVRTAAVKVRMSDKPTTFERTPEHESAGTTYRWNMAQTDLPLLGLAQEHLNIGFEQSLTYPTAQFEFLIFKALTFDEADGRYLLPAIASDSRAQTFIEFAPGKVSHSYVSKDGIELLDKGSLKVVKTSDGTKYFFVRYPDDEFRCATIKHPSGGALNMVYTANGLALHGVVDSFGRRLIFNYGRQRIESVTQNWLANSEPLTKTWPVGEEKPADVAIKYAHAVALPTGKFLPQNAVVQEYTDEMAASDQFLARIFGGPNAVVGGNGFEPTGLAAPYPFYRGDIRGDDGKIRLGHLSHALHIYGSPTGTATSPLYVPGGFTSHSPEPSSTDAAVLFYYPKLGNLTDVTLAVFHVTDFQIMPEGDRVRIGSLGGPGGSSPLYKHSHIDFYRGNVSALPEALARAGLRIDPATVFGSR